MLPYPLVSTADTAHWHIDDVISGESDRFGAGIFQRLDQVDSSNGRFLRPGISYQHNAVHLRGRRKPPAIKSRLERSHPRANLDGPRRLHFAAYKYFPSRILDDGNYYYRVAHPRCGCHSNRLTKFCGGQSCRLNGTDSVKGYISVRLDRDREFGIVLRMVSEFNVDLVIVNLLVLSSAKSEDSP